MVYPISCPTKTPTRREGIVASGRKVLSSVRRLPNVVVCARWEIRSSRPGVVQQRRGGGIGTPTKCRRNEINALCETRLRGVMTLFGTCMGSRMRTMNGCWRSREVVVQSAGLKHLEERTRGTYLLIIATRLGRFGECFVTRVIMVLDGLAMILNCCEKPSSIWNAQGSLGLR